MSAPDIFALGGRQENQDSDILALFHQWLEACRVLDKINKKIGDGDDTPEWNEACDRQGDIEGRIFACHGGPLGLAVKTFLHLYRYTSNWAPSLSQLRFDGSEDQPLVWLESMLRDAAGLVPQIGECAAAVLHVDAELIDADMDAQWASDRLADPPGPCETPESRNDYREKLRNSLARIANTPAQTPRGEAIKAKHAGATGGGGVARR
jgi:hypothetical protein